jgi:hypothetical protein
MIKEVKQKVEEKINNILEQGIQSDNVEVLGELVDIHKDMANEEYWEKKKEVMSMNYRGYGEYDEGNYNEGRYGARRRDSRGRYMARGRGRGNYRGEEMMDEMAYHYGNYNESREQYGADEETMKSFKYMLKSFKDYYKHLKEEASSQQEVRMLEEVAREISEM